MPVVLLCDSNEHPSLELPPAMSICWSWPGGKSLSSPARLLHMHCIVECQAPARVLCAGTFPFDHTENPDPNCKEAHTEVWAQQTKGSWSEVPHIKKAVQKVRWGSVLPPDETLCTRAAVSASRSTPAWTPAGISTLQVVGGCLLLIWARSACNACMRTTTAVRSNQNPLSEPSFFALQLSPEVKDLLDRILVPKEEERITIPEIEAHPWCVHCCRISAHSHQVREFGDAAAMPLET